MSQHIPLTQLPLDTRISMTPRQVHEHVAFVTGKSIAEYHKKYHTPFWKRVALRVAAEVQSFKTAVNEDYGKDHEKGRMWWQRAANAIGRFLERLSSLGSRIANTEIVEDFEDAADEGEATVRHVDKRAGR